jgi:hypothetical protein
MAAYFAVVAWQRVYMPNTIPQRNVLPQDRSMEKTGINVLFFFRPEIYPPNGIYVTLLSLCVCVCVYVYIYINGGHAVA